MIAIAWVTKFGKRSFCWGDTRHLVIFVDFQGPRSKIPCFCGQNAMSEFSPISVKTTCFRQGTKRPFSKTTVSTTLTRRLWRSQRRKSSSVPEGGANFPAAIFLAGKGPNLAGIAVRAAGKLANNFPAASKFAQKLFQQEISDSHSLLELSEMFRKRQKARKSRVQEVIRVR